MNLFMFYAECPWGRRFFGTLQAHSAKDATECLEEKLGKLYRLDFHEVTSPLIQIREVEGRKEQLPHERHSMTFLDLARRIMEGPQDLMHQEVTVSAMTLSRNVVNSDVYLQEDKGKRFWLLKGFDPPIRSRKERLGGRRFEEQVVQDGQEEEAAGSEDPDQEGQRLAPDLRPHREGEVSKMHDERMDSDTVAELAAEAARVKPEIGAELRDQFGHRETADFYHGFLCGAASTLEITSDESRSPPCRFEAGASLVATAAQELQRVEADAKPRYVLGFAFTPHQKVVLIEKSRPFWQAGRLNGVGGKVERGETGREAIVREFKEEAGVETGAEQWYYFCRLVKEDRVTECFYARAILGVRTATDERIVEAEPRDLPDNVIPNLKWLVPMAYLGEGFALMDYEQNPC